MAAGGARRRGRDRARRGRRGRRHGHLPRPRAVVGDRGGRRALRRPARRAARRAGTAAVPVRPLRARESVVVKPPPFEYVVATSVDEALQALAGGATVLAGGQSLLPQL